MRGRRVVSRDGQRRRWVNVVMALVLFGALVPVAGQTVDATRGVDTVAVEDGRGDTDPALWAGIAADARDEVYTETAGSLSDYRIALGVTPPATDDDLTELEGTVELLFVNPLEDTLDEVVFRLYANDDRYGAGEIEMTNVVVGDEAVEPDLSLGDTIATVALPTGLAPGETVAITYAFSGVVDNDPAGSYGMFTYSPGSGTLALAHWYPVLAGIEPDGDWKVGPTSVNGDPIYSNTSLYDVTITMPTAWRVTASGAEVETTEDDGVTSHRFVTGPSRDFSFVADESFRRMTQEVGDTVVSSWYEAEDEVGGRQVLDAGVASLVQFEPLIGDYPYAELDLVQVSVGNGAAGIEFPQLVFIGGAYYGEPVATSPEISFLESLVVHEVLHQWFYGIIGNDQYAHGFQDESLANYLMVYYYQLAYDPDTFEVAYLSQVEISFLEYLFGVNDVIVDTPTDDFVTGSDYTIAAYYKGPVALNALLESIGEDAFFAGLNTYYTEFRFAVATPDDLRAAFEQASGEDLGDFWTHWFEEAAATDDFSPADLEAAEDRLADLLAS